MVPGSGQGVEEQVWIIQQTVQLGGWSAAPHCGPASGDYILILIINLIVYFQDNMSMFALLSVDSEEGSLAIVTRDMSLRHSSAGGSMLTSLHTLLESFVEACAFHAWSLLL